LARGELRQAEQAFRTVEELGRSEGALNLARVYLEEGRLAEAVGALRRAAAHEKPPPPWSVTWFSGLANEQNGFLDEAVEDFRALAETSFDEARRRGFDFGSDYRLLNKLGQALFERAKQERGAAKRARREALLREARDVFERTLALDPENMTAHFNLALVHDQLGDPARSRRHRELHERYRPDDNARDRAVAAHRRANPAADRAAEPTAIYELRPKTGPSATVAW
jgi:tetratricopeptide (TPR) repeat protein